MTLAALSIAALLQSVSLFAITPDVQGIDEHLAENVLAHVGEIKPLELNNTTRLFRNLNRAVENALQPYGYYHAKSFISVEDEKLTIRIDAGDPVLLAEVDVRIVGEAAQDPRFQLTVDGSTLRSGAQLNHAEYELLREDLLELARELGYFDAHYSQSVLTVNPGTLTARPTLHLVSGTRYRFGQLSLLGTEVDAHLLHAKANFSEGEYFTQTKLTAYEQYLLDSGYFELVRVDTKPSDGALVDVTVELKDVDANRIEVGAGVSTDTSFRFRFNHLNPRINSEGHSIETATQFSKIEQSLDTKYRVPVVNSFKNFYQFSAGAKNEEVQDTQSTTASVGARKFGQLGEDWNWSYGASLEYESFRIGDDSREKTTYLLPGTSMDFTSLEKGRDPRRGYHYAVDAAVSTPELGADTSFARVRGTGKWLFPVGSSNATVLTRLDLGAVLTDKLEEVPASLRFNTGGDNSIRGYDYESLSTTDEEGNLTGSQYLAVGSVELSFLVRPNWRAAVFVDAGSAFTTGEDDIYRGAGIGLRWLSPVGQIRFDLATPVGSSEHNGVRLHVSMGPPL